MKIHHNYHSRVQNKKPGLWFALLKIEGKWCFTMNRDRWEWLEAELLKRIDFEDLIYFGHVPNKHMSTRYLD